MTELGVPHTTLNLLRYDLINFHCGPLVYRSIIHWGFALPEGMIIIDHINDLKIVEKNKEKKFTKWLKDNESKLNKDSFSSFDVTTLHNFLPIICCEKISKFGEQEYDKQIKDPNSVESLLKEIKTFRNDVSHESAEAVKDSHIYKMKETMRECIYAAGKLYGKDQAEIDKKVKYLDDEFQEILLNTARFYENRVKNIAKFIETEVSANLLERYAPHFSIPLPDNLTKKNTSDIFYFCKLSVTTENQEGKAQNNIANKTVFPCTDLFNYKHNKFVVINGGPGSGKTFLMQNIYQDILMTSVHESTPRYENIEEFKVPIYFECRIDQQTNLAKFLKECLKNFLSPEDDIYEAFKIVKGLVFLIDGYDPIDSNCRKLVDSIIHFCRDYNASCIISCSVDAGICFVKELKNINLISTKMFIEPINELTDKVNFLIIYSNKILNSIDTNKLKDSFENLTATAKEVFSSPILLVLFISLFVHDPDLVTRMKNEQSVYKAVRTSFLREMERRLENVPNPKGRANDVAYVLSKFCLKLFRVKKYFLGEEDCSKIIGECEKIKGIPDDVDITSVLSCILTKEQSLKFTPYKSYKFMHSTIFEYFAATYISEKIRELEDGQLPKLLQALELDESQSDIEKEMERYGNIIKFLILETLANGELPKYSNTFTVLLKKYFTPKQDILRYYPTVYHLDLILSSDSNADIISIVSDCLRDWGMYDLEYYRHIKPMTEVMQTMKTGVRINFSSFEVTNTQKIMKLLTVLGDDSKIELNLNHSNYNYQPLEGEFYTQLKNSNFRCEVTRFAASIASEEHLSIVVRVLRGNYNSLLISSLSVSDFSFAALEEHKGRLFLRVKYPNNCPSYGSNPVRDGTFLHIEHTPADVKEKLYNTIKYICPKSEKFDSIYLDHCLLTDTDANELLKKLHGEKIRTRWGNRTEVMELRVYGDKSRGLQFHLKESEPEERVKKRVKKSEEEGRESEDNYRKE